MSIYVHNQCMWMWHVHSHMYDYNYTWMCVTNKLLISKKIDYCRYGAIALSSVLAVYICCTAK